MNECEHCGEAFESEEACREHVQLRHDEIPDAGTDGTSWPGGDRRLYLGAPVAAVALIVVIGAGFALLGGGGASGTTHQAASCPEAETQPRDVGSVHYHGTTSVIVNGNEHELAKLKYYLEDEAWHVENANSAGDNVTWHTHAKNVTLQYALNSLDGFCAPNASAVQVNGTWYYGDDPSVTVRYLVNGQEVDPRAYTFEAGDEILVVAKDQ